MTTERQIKAFLDELDIDNVFVDDAGDGIYIIDGCFNLGEAIERAQAYRQTSESETLPPHVIAAAWNAWHSRHGGKLGPGPAFVEAITAAVVALNRSQ